MATFFDNDHTEFLKLLNKHEVEYLLIGGVAVNLHGYSRGTGDMDIWIGSTPANKEKIIAAIEEFGYDTSDYKKKDIKEITIFSLGSRSQPGHIELTNRIAGVSFEDAYTRVQSKEIEGISIKYIHYDDLIKNKSASARLRDLDDVENLKKIKQQENNLPVKPSTKNGGKDYK